MSLKILQEISSLVTNYTKKNRKNGDGKAGSLLEGLQTQTWESEEDAHAFLYPKKLGNKSFAMLKTRAKEQLVNQIFQLDTQKRYKSSYDRAYFNACKNLLAGALLWNQNKHYASIESFKNTIKLAERYHFTDILVMALRQMRSTAIFHGGKSKYKQYDMLLKKAVKTLNSEIEAEELNQELTLEVISGVDFQEPWMMKVADNFSRLKKIVNSNDTYTTRLAMYRVGIRYYDSINDFNNAIRLATECEKYLHANPHLIQKVRLGEMNLNKLYGALHLREYEEGSTYAATCMTLFNPGTLNWLIFLEYYFLLCLHTSNYDKAAEIYAQVLSHPGFDSYPPQNKEKWKIFEAFLIYALPESHKMSRKFNTAKFLNEVPLFSKDKAGYNLSIIIAQIILSLKLGDYTKILDKAESIRTYAARYIRKEKNPRSYYFMKMILTMIRYDFDPKKTAQIAEKFFQKLKASHLGGQSELETLEVIPYDLLWPEVIDRLEKNRLKLVG